MKHLFLDTSAYSIFKRGGARFVELISGADRIFVNAIVVGELLVRFDLGKFREENRRELKAFLTHPSVAVLPISEETAERYSHIYRHLREQGTPIPTNDLWIAASVMESGTILITNDHHFSRIPQIQTVSLREGSNAP